MGSESHAGPVSTLCAYIWIPYIRPEMAISELSLILESLTNDEMNIQVKRIYKSEASCVWVLTGLAGHKWARTGPVQYGNI